jgi:ubiquinone/menaquinone biosynthesis C-methylase UbiE
MRILDFGAGTGELATLIELHIQGAHVDCLDMNPRGPRVEQFKFSMGQSIPRPNKTFDKVLCISVLQYFSREEINAFFYQVRRVLKPHGEVVIVTPSLFNTHGRTSTYLNRNLKASGFTITSKKRIGGRVFGYWKIVAVAEVFNEFVQ